MKIMPRPFLCPYYPFRVYNNWQFYFAVSMSFHLHLPLPLFSSFDSYSYVPCGSCSGGKQCGQYFVRKYGSWGLVRTSLQCGVHHQCILRVLHVHRLLDHVGRLQWT